MTSKDRQIEIEYYERKLVEEPDGKEIWEEELSKLKRYVGTKKGK